MESKKVSIVIPLYKSEKFLPKLLDSVVDQTYKNLEIILVDDGSPDNSGKIADDYKEKDDRIVVIHKANGGCCDARNKGLEKATGYYLMFADGDDWLESDCIEYLVRIAEENGCEMSTTDAIFTTRDRVQNESDNVRVWSPEKALWGIIRTDVIPVGPWNKLYTMDVVKKNSISFSVPWFGEGLYFSAMNAQFSNKTAVGHRKIYYYRLNNPNSGCTVKEVQNGINALRNIKYIKRKAVLHNPEIDNAFDWHIWCNNGVLIQYIVAASAEKEYKEMLSACKKERWNLLPSVLLHSGLNLKLQLSAIAGTVAPTIMAKRAERKFRISFKNDVGGTT